MLVAIAGIFPRGARLGQPVLRLCSVGFRWHRIFVGNELYPRFTDVIDSVKSGCHAVQAVRKAHNWYCK